MGREKLVRLWWETVVHNALGWLPIILEMRLQGLNFTQAYRFHWNTISIMFRCCRSDNSLPLTVLSIHMADPVLASSYSLVNTHGGSSPRLLSQSCQYSWRILNFAQSYIFHWNTISIILRCCRSDNSLPFTVFSIHMADPKFRTNIYISLEYHFHNVQMRQIR